MLEEILLSDLLSRQSFLVEKLASRPQSDTWAKTRMSENASKTVWGMEVEVWKLHGCSKQVLLYANHPSKSTILWFEVTKIDHSFTSVNSDKIRTNSDVWSTTPSGLVASLEAPLRWNLPRISGVWGRHNFMAQVQLMLMKLFLLLLFRFWFHCERS